MQYKYIINPFITLIITQIIKFLIEMIETKKVNVYRLLNGNGGMPSTHTAFTTSMAVSVGIGTGFDSTVFACALIFAIIVAYDSMGLRMESSKHAETINKLMEYNGLSKKYSKLKEMLGHKPLEVFVGVIFGTVSAFIQMNIF